MTARDSVAKLIILRILNTLDALAVEFGGCCFSGSFNSTEAASVSHSRHTKACDNSDTHRILLMTELSTGSNTPRVQHTKMGQNFQVLLVPPNTALARAWINQNFDFHLQRGAVSRRKSALAGGRGRDPLAAERLK